MNPSLKQQLKKWKQQHQESTPKKKSATKNKGKHNSEEFTESALRYLMGANMRTLRRGKGGAWK
ncbi:hypothetical protein [Schinkia azotoformans]|uniref:hypothetical protein n=1 Tax=Schinkia azotoformans TaxID=1454 RepID=UPI002DBAE569|nr:hypothetical protein [Schinkia azotoformans]MEC1744135.1 hypothetical protein [Schinkia azotoformans]